MLKMNEHKNKYEKALSRIKKNIDLSDDWSEEDYQHYFTIIEALEKCSQND